jgi:hypothetical protein
MKKLLSIILAITVLGIFSACSSKKPYKEEQISDQKAMVYIYRKSVISDLDNVYRVYLNNLLVKDVLRDNGYLHFEVKEGDLTVNVRRGVLFEHSVSLHVKNSQTYYIRAVSVSDSGDFKLEVVDNATGKSEIATTVYYDETRDDMFYHEDKKKPEVKPATSNAQEIERLYNLKEKGIITQDEYETLKAKVIN